MSICARIRNDMEGLAKMQRYLTLDEVRERLGGRSRSAIYADLAAGRLPQPVKLGARVYWPERDLAEFLERLHAQPRAPQRGAA